jgi:excisionase family DNA binding protein
MAVNDTTRNHADTVEEELLTVDEVQELLKVGRTFAYSLVRSGELPSYRVGRLLRVRRQDIDHWLEHNRCVASK